MQTLNIFKAIKIKNLAIPFMIIVGSFIYTFLSKPTKHYHEISEVNEKVDSVKQENNVFEIFTKDNLIRVTVHIYERYKYSDDTTIDIIDTAGNNIYKTLNFKDLDRESQLKILETMILRK